MVKQAVDVLMTACFFGGPGSEKTAYPGKALRLNYG